MEDKNKEVAIARALVLNPKILLCDEATSALDPQITRDILNLLLKNQQRDEYYDCSCHTSKWKLLNKSVIKSLS